jgi:NAD(P)H-dependent FMN reductase
MSDEDDKKIVIKFAPGALEALEENMDPQELQEFLNTLKAKVEDGSIFEESTEVDWEELEEEDPETYERLTQSLDEVADETDAQRKKKLN